MGRTQTASNIAELERRIQECEANRKKLIDFLQELKNKWANREITYFEYEQIINEKRDGKTIQEWFEYYNNYIQDCKRRIKEQEKKSLSRKIFLTFSSLFIISVIFFSVFYLRPAIQGLIVKEEKQEFIESLNLEFSNPSEYQWNPQHPGLLNSLKISGSIEGEGEVKIYLGDLLILDSSKIKAKGIIGAGITGKAVEETTQAETPSETPSSPESASPSQPASSPSSSEITQEAQTSPSQNEPPASETQTTESIQAETRPETETTPEQPQQPTETPTTEAGINETPEQPTQPAENITPTQPQENITQPENITIPEQPAEIAIKEFLDTCEETCNLKPALNKSSYTLRIEITNAKLKLQEIKYEITKEEILLPPPPENITPPINITPTENITNITIPEKNITQIENLTLGNATITTLQFKAKIGQPVKWKKTLNLEKPSIVKVKLPSQAENITVKKILEQEEKEISEEQPITIQPETETPEETPSPEVRELREVKERLEEVEKELREIKEILKESRNQQEQPTENITQPTQPEENITPTQEVTETTITGKASFTLTTITGKAIEEQEKFSLINFFRKIISKISASITGRTITTEEKPEEEAIEVTIEDNATKYEIEYETPAPQAFEEQISETRKQITISAPDELNYTDILAYTELAKEAPEEKVKLYHLVNESREEVIITKFDTNNNSLTDYIEWNVPHLSNETYELIIEISKAEHLDENKTFISDIYEQVKALDDVWSEEIPDKHYVRVTFRENLTSKNDITLYPRIISGNPKIEVYEKDKNELIAEFSSLNSNSYNKVFLTNLQGSQDTFDLLIKGGSIQLEHIIDPPGLEQYYLIGGSVTGDAGAGSLSTSTGNARAIWQTNADGQYYTWTKKYTIATDFNIQTFIIGFYCNATSAAVGGSKVEVDDFYVYDCGTSSTCATQDATICSVTAQDIACNSITAATWNTLSCTSSTSRTLDANDYLGVRLVADIADNKAPDLRLHFNSSTFNSYVNVTESWDISSPYFNQIPTNTTLTYGTSYITQINATDDTTVSCFAVNDSKFSVNCSGYLRNTTALATNLYYLNLTVNDTVNNVNTTSFWVNVTQAGDTFTYLLNGASNNLTITFPQQANATIQNNKTTATIVMNSTTLTSGANFSVGAGVWFINYSVAGNQNYTSNETYLYLTVNKSNNSITPLLNGNNANLVVTFPQQINASYSNGNYTTLTLSINNTEVTPGTNYTWGVGVWFVNYSLASNQNYSANESYLNLTMNQGTGLVYAWINNTRSNFNATTDNSNNTWLNATLEAGAGNIELWLNGSIINSGSSPLSNLTNFSTGYYNVTAVYSGNQNYTFSNETWWINVTTVSANNLPQIYAVYNASISPLSLTEGPSYTAITLNFSVSDADGYTNLVDSSSQGNITNATGVNMIRNSSCSRITTESAGNYANYTCVITLAWWYNAGTWNISVNITDANGNKALNSTTTFQIAATTGLVASSLLTWPSVAPNSINQTATNYILLNNTGNTAITDGNIQINATRLKGETDSNLALYAGNFSVAPFTGGVSPNFFECNSSSTTMSRSVFTGITGANLSAGNFSINDGSIGQEQLYICLKLAGSELSSQPYSTSAEGSWTIKILVVALALTRRKRKKKIKEDKLIHTIELITDELKEKYSLDETEIIDLIIKKLREKYKISEKELIEIIEKEQKNIPATIFSKKLGALEALCKYMKENLNLPYNEIAKMLNRNERTIWTAYKQAEKKQPEPLKIKETEIFLPISILRNRDLTILESVIIYLKNKGLKHSDIAKLLERDQRNIWTIYSRAVRKIKKKSL